jgi:transposase
MKPDEEVIQLRAENQALRDQLEERDQQLAQRDELITQLKQRLQLVEERLAKDSHNSHLPPSSDRFVRQPKSLRKRSGKKPGGQAGHPGQSLRFSATPDEVVVHVVSRCQHCQQDLQTVPPLALERRQVVDVPPPRQWIREHQAEQKVCPQCQKLTVAPFPEEVRAPVQYGSCIGAIAVYLVEQQLLPWDRTCEVMQDLLGVSMSQGTLCSLIERCARQLRPLECLTKAALGLCDVLHQDETGLYVMGKRYWMHVSATATLTHYAVHPARGVRALQAIGLLEKFAGVSVHDGWQSYWQYDCGHALCNVHVLRDLTFVEEEHHQDWAGQMKELLLTMKAQVEDAKASGQSALPHPLYQRLIDYYRRLLLQGYLDNLPDPPTLSTSPPTRGRRKQSAALNLLDRLWDQQEAVLAFLYDFAVPFDNDYVAYCTPSAWLACCLIFASVLLRSMLIRREDCHPMSIGSIHGKQSCSPPLHNGLSGYSIGLGGFVGR